ncbi:BMA_0021/BMA_0022 family TOMM bacteriocin [Myxococcus sp. K15C18031901]|uniref:BMA_0021/BMA_0022 family TOMM bacteriocin n=1 Tax=Myxococcus dinghuensis TaxID=2906761 RepID=UPI0020A7B438|nr:BMA_0021/BMA_0022 family TOMM bacteriocin [Myxococcus dinghuensis]MCP3097294.1 BMA_0021/BMA_0022 family TOMM bacteriocin [Myxococcus dinghuensis]
MNMNNEAPFPQLRTAYLRAIAQAWREPSFEKELVAESLRPRGVLDFLEEKYHFKFPFDVKLVINTTSRPQWMPIGSTGWYGFADGFELHLPEKPEDDANCASVLARYCEQFPSLLGQGEDFVSAPPDFAEVGVLTGRLLALTWRDKVFADQLFDAKDARGLFQDAMDCILPWNFNLRFHRWSGPDSKGPNPMARLLRDPDTDVYWKSFPRSVITLHLPLRPLPVDVQAVALAAYNDTGGQYPFTCG